jgi:uncharacterized protein
MPRILLWLVLFFVVRWLWKRARRDDARRAAGSHASGSQAPDYRARSAGQSAHASAQAPAQLPDPLVRCAQCGVHAPFSDAMVVDGHSFCSRDHALRYAKRPTGRAAR